MQQGHAPCPKCGSSDANYIYPDGSSHCFAAACGYTVPSQEYIDAQAGKDSRTKSKGFKSKTERVEVEVQVKQKAVITDEQRNEIKENSTFIKKEYRGIRPETYKAFGVRHSMYEDGELADQFYPVTQDGLLTGYKIRSLPKSFGNSKGRTGADCDLFGQFKYKTSGRNIVLTEGEIDAMSAWQMFQDFNKSKGWDYETAVVSPTIGSNCAKQIKKQFKFLDQFEKIYLCFDSDSAGTEAAEALIRVLPKGKVFMFKMRLKDANEYLKQDQASAFIKDFYEAKPHVPAGVLSSSDLFDRILSQADLEKVPMPPFAKKLEDMLGNGLSLGYIYNIAAMTGIGKTSVINEFIYYWIFNSPHMIGVVSMELNAGQYGEVLLSRHIQLKLARLNAEERTKRLGTEATKAAAKELFSKPDGTPRFFLVEDRDGTVEQLQDTIEEMVIGSGVKIVVLDVLQDILEGMSNEEQGLFMKWCKSMIKSHGISFVLINHMRKTSAGTSAEKVTEDDIHGSSTIMKSAGANILLSRDKDAEDPIVRNTTIAVVSKNRVTGDTGPAGKWYYDNQAHVMHDFDEFMLSEQGQAMMQY